LHRVATHPEIVNFFRAGQRADDDRKFILASFGVNNIFKQPRLAFFFRESAAILPADERMNLRVLVDRLFDTPQQSARFECF
jgi:hypothetical protein